MIDERDTLDCNNKGKSDKDTNVSANYGRNTRRRSKGKSGRKGKRGGSRTFKQRETPKNYSKTNDPTWYSLNPELLDRSTRLQFGTPTGHIVDLTGRFGEKVKDTGSATMATPGIAILTYAHGLGKCTGQSNAVQSSMFDLYASVRKGQTSYATYDPEDYMMYLLAINEVYIFYSMLSRAYGLLNTYNVESMYLPRALIQDLGFDFDDLARNKLQLANLLDSIAAQINVFAVPNVLNYMVRQYWLPSQVYSDAATTKHQLYAFRPAYYRVWNEMNDKGSKLVTKTYPWIGSKGNIASAYTRLTVQKCQEIATEMITALQNSQDVGVMSANVRQAYGDNLWNLAAFDENYQLIPLSDYNVLAQIENATLSGPAVQLSDFDISQDPTLNASQIIYNPRFRAISGTIMGDNGVPVHANGGDSRLFNRVLVAHTDSTDESFIMEASRFVIGGYSSERDVVDLVYGTETLAGITIYSSMDNTTPPVNMGALFTSDSTAAMNTVGVLTPRSDAAAGMQFMLEAYKFDWFPRMYLGTLEGAEGSEYWHLQPMLDLDNFSVVTKTDLEQLHYVAILSMFNVKTTG